MENKLIQGFIDLETAKVKKYFGDRMYGIERSLGQLQALTNLAVFINDMDRVAAVGLVMLELAEEFEKRVAKIEDYKEPKGV